MSRYASWRWQRARLVAAVVGAVMVVGTAVAIWAVLATPGQSRAAVTVTLAVSCRKCVPCGPGGACPACDHKLGAAAAGVDGVVSASFVEHRSYGVGHVTYQRGRTSLAVIEATIERAPPYPGCCSNLHSTAT